MWISLKRLVRAEDRTISVISTQKDVREPARELFSDLPERELLTRTSRALH